MMIREACFAGRFYPGQPDQCRAEVESCVRKAKDHVSEEAAKIGDRMVGGIVPHAGWIYSGPTAARVFSAFAEREHPDVIILFGAVHLWHGSRPSIFASGAWETPLGLQDVDGRLSERLLGQTGLLESDPHAHEGEHSIEVQVPFVQHLLPETRIIPIMAPVNDASVTLGKVVGNACRNYGVKAAFVGSTDLTHYGPSFGYTPQGVGPDGLAWSRDVNDRRMIDLMLSMRADDVVEEAVVNRSACGGGAIAATLAACTAFGATRATLLEHTTSAEVGQSFSSVPPRDAVGYAAAAFS